MLQIPLSPETEALLRERASAHGEEVSTFAENLLRQALCTPSVDELLAPFRNQIAESGVSDDELDALGESLRDEIWHEQQAKKAAHE